MGFLSVYERETSELLVAIFTAVSNTVRFC